MPNYPNLAAVVATIKVDPLTNEVRVPEQLFFKKMTHAAKRLNISFYVIQMDDYQTAENILYGYVWEYQQWNRQQVPLPDLIYDRRFHTKYSDYALSSKQLRLLQRSHKSTRLNATLPNKWTVHQLLQSDPTLIAHLPPTIQLSTTAQLLTMLETYPDGLIIKPKAGMQGKGIVRIQAVKELINSWRISGRTWSNQSFSTILSGTEALIKKFHTIIASGRYLLQPYLTLTNNNHTPFDLRCLLQKNESGLWQMTGIAVRCGQSTSITSNLHGGGTAISLATLCDQLVTPIDRNELEKSVQSLSVHTATLLERKLGKFAELAFDFGLDQQNQLWLLEVNSRPGRQSFEMINDNDAHLSSIIRPLQYSRYLFQHTNYDRLFPHMLPTNKRSLNIQEVHR